MAHFNFNNYNSLSFLSLLRLLAFSIEKWNWIKCSIQMEFIFQMRVYACIESTRTLLLSSQFHGWMQTRARVWSRTNSIFFFEPGYDINLENNEWHDIKIKPNNCFLRTNCDDAHCAIEWVPSSWNPVGKRCTWVSACVRSWSRTRVQSEQNGKCCGFEAHAKPRYDGSSNSFYYASIFQMLFFLPLLSLTMFALPLTLFHALSLSLSLSIALKRKSLCNYRRCHNRRCYLY